jgi:hypothetical protein
MAVLKGIIIGLTGTIYDPAGKVNQSLLSEMIRLIAFIKHKGLKPIILTNISRIVTNSDGTKKTLKDVMRQSCGDMDWFAADKGDCPYKPQAASILHVLDKTSFHPHEVLYLGNSQVDMQTALHGKVLFLNAVWYEMVSAYGLFFGSPMFVARFIDLFCMRDHLWFFAINDGGTDYRALSPFSTMLSEFREYSEDARSTLKLGTGHEDFWAKYFCSSIYFSQLYRNINYMAPYPGHIEGANDATLEKEMIAFSKCFQITYVKDLILRHTTAMKSAYARANARARGQQHSLDHLNQLNTIMLNRSPLRNDIGKRYKNFPVKSGKAILVFDDFCTDGFSLESAKAYLERTGGKIFLASWLKTINTDYHQLSIARRFDPFQPNRFTADEISVRALGYRSHIVDRSSPDELSDRFRQYDHWDWPRGL